MLNLASQTNVKKTKIFRYLNGLLITTITAIWLRAFHGVTNIKLGPIDDHEIVNFLGSDGILPLQEIPSVLTSKTEVGQWGDYSRFRPVYFLLRLLETAFFKQNTEFWFLFRIFLVILTCIFAIKILLFFVPENAGLLRFAFISIFYSSFMFNTSWLDVAARLGPSEVYALPAFFIAIYYGLKLISDSKNRIHFAFFAIATVIAVGSKENFTYMALAVILVVLIRFYASGKLFTLFNLQSALIIILALLVLIGPAISYKKSGADVYGDSRGLGKSVSLFIQYYSSALFTLKWLLILVPIFILISSRLNLSERFEKEKILSFVILYLSLFSAWEYVFYNGSFDTPRYAIASELNDTLLFGLLLLLLIRNLLPEILAKSQKRYILCVAIFSLLIASLGTYKSISKNSKEIRMHISERIAVTKSYQEQITEIHQLLDQANINNVIIQVDDFSKYEPAYAVSKYLQVNSPAVSKAIKTGAITPGSELESTLIENLKQKEQFGDNEWNLLPISKIISVDKIFCITFSDSKADSKLCSNEYSIN